MQDAYLNVSKALPNGVNSVTTDAIDTQNSSTGDFVVGELVIEAPALVTADLPDTKVMTYAVINSDNSDLSSPTTLDADVIVQTGAGGAGAAASTVTFDIPVDVKRYIGVSVSNDGTGDASDKSVTAYIQII